MPDTDTIPVLPALDEKCLNCDGDGWISNAAEYAAWEARYDAAKTKYLTIAGTGWNGSWEEMQVQRDAPDECVGCVEREGTGKLLTDAGRTLLAFLDRHRNVNDLRNDLRSMGRRVERAERDAKDAGTCRRCGGLGCASCV